MRPESTEQLIRVLTRFCADTRLYALSLADAAGDLATGGADDFGAGGLMVEAFRAADALQGLGVRDLVVLSTNAAIAPANLLGKRASLAISLVNGERARFGGYITEFSRLGGQRGLGRYRLRLSPWIWLLSRQTNNRVWQDSTLIAIVDSVFQAYQPRAHWRWSADVARFMQRCPRRAYCCQYQENDFDFVRRLLTEEGIAWRHEDANGEECLVLFADSSALSAAPEDPSSVAGPGIRFHGARAVEKSDTIQSLQIVRKLSVGRVTLLSYDDRDKRIVSTSVNTKFPLGGKRAPLLESFDCPGTRIFADSEHARHHAGLQIEGHEARSKVWRVRSTVRTLRPGTRVRMTNGPLDAFRTKAAEYVVVRMVSLGVNNLPTAAKLGLAELFGPVEALLTSVADEAALPEIDLAITQAVDSGYGNCFEAIPADRPWRPMFDGSGGCTHTRPTAPGSQSAIVVGMDGAAEPNGADEMCCDRSGRVRIRFHWQRGTESCWVRVGQRLAGGGLGSQFLPRIGQEVVVQFMEGNIDRPVIVGALYNGRGEGGVMPTPAGKPAEPSNTAVFAIARDHRNAGQGNFSMGNSPVWHGAAAGSAAHANVGAQWGIRSKEMGGRGYNQLVFDDTDGQGRVQLRCTHAATELNLGHLIHTADNYRGSYRGQGAELRTDAYGAVRAGAGLLISSYKIRHAADMRDAAGSNDESAALLKQAQLTATGLSAAARTHKTVAFAGAHGNKAAPLDALAKMAAGMVSTDNLGAALSDAGAGNVAAGVGKVPHLGGPIIAIAAHSGLGVVAGQDLQLSSGETVSLISGQDSQFVSGGQLRVHSGQAIGMLGGAEKPGASGIGMQLIAAQDNIDLQAQADELKVQARDQINVISANAHIDWAAAKSISLSTAGGANITIEGGNIRVQCPGKIMVHAGMKRFAGPARTNYPLPEMPRSICVECLKKSLEAAPAFTLVE
jgi:type VI secretion system secreted protein VgrG